jgi:hypothetical protein
MRLAERRAFRPGTASSHPGMSGMASTTAAAIAPAPWQA